jgi:Ca2+-binding RTX toxin-like protein
MPSVTIPGVAAAPLTFSSNDAAPYANALSVVIGGGLSNGTLQPYTYTGGLTGPGPSSGTGGALIIATASTPVAIPLADIATIITSTGPVSITGGGAGETVVAGSGGLDYTGITPDGTAIDYIAAGDGANLITTSTTATGNYAINTGSGNDTISVYGNSVINAGTGNNTVSIGGGNNLVYSEGYDTITGSTVPGGGVDTVNIGSGQTSIDPGAQNFFIFASAEPTNPLVLMAGTGSDTVSVGAGGGNITAGSGGASVLIGGTGSNSATLTTLHGTASGDQIYAVGGGSVYATAGAGNETITGAGGTPAGLLVGGSSGSDTFVAGSGNDTLVAGTGTDSLDGGSGSALMLGGTGADTFAFQFGGGGHDTITGFSSTDTLQLTGFGITSVPTQASGGNLVIALSDGTTITLTGVTSLAAGHVVLK